MDFGQRLGKPLLPVLAVLLGLVGQNLMAAPAQAQGGAQDESVAAAVHEALGEVLRHPDFSTQKWQDSWRWFEPHDQAEVDHSKPWVNLTPLIEFIVGAVKMLPWVILAAMVLFGILLWGDRPAYRHARLPHRPCRAALASTVTVAHNVHAIAPNQALALAREAWGQGQPRQALLAMYSGALSAALAHGVHLPSSATEMECVLSMQRAATEAAAGQSFETITTSWMRLAYGGLAPNDAEFEQLCAHLRKLGASP